jgi:hypothetical protein
MQRPADFELLIGRKRQQACSANQLPVLAALNGPAAGRRQQLRVFGDPLFQQHAHGFGVLDAADGRGQPARDPLIAVRAERGRSIAGVPAAQNKALRYQCARHSLNPSDPAQATISGSR